MKEVCVITGGGSGMGLETAKLLGKNQKIVLAGRTLRKLENAVSGLCALGIEAEPFACDVGNRAEVLRLAEYAESLGTVKTVVHAAGVSPRMADAEKIFNINAEGTVNVDEVFGEKMNGGVILNVSSMSGYMLPENIIPKEIYSLSLKDSESFRNAFISMLEKVPDAQKTGMAYSVSKNFVIWFTSKMAVRYGKKGLRVISVSPGTFSTPMGEIEGEESAGFAINGALGRIGRPEEIAELMAFLVSDRCSYLTGADILYDGGAIASFKDRMERNAVR